MFKAFPEQGSIDGTHKTTRGAWELITYSVQDMSGKQEVVIRCWAPNNRAWLFKWLFQTAFPALVGEETLEHVKLIITDGDSQETSQLDNAIAAIFINAKWRRCGWHIVDCGWKKHLAIQRPKAHHDWKAIKTLCGLIKQWMYSWMKNIETVEEYEM